MVIFLSGNKGGRPKGYKLSEETKQKIRQAKVGEKHPLFGTHRPQEVKDKISEKLAGREFSEETRDKISKAKRSPFRNLELFDELVRDYADDPESIKFLINNLMHIMDFNGEKICLVIRKRNVK